MSIFYTLINKLRFSKVTSIDKNEIFAIGTNKQVKNGYALLKNGKIIANNLMWISSNLLSESENAQKDYILAKPVANVYLIFNKYGKCLTPEGLKIFRSKNEVSEDYPLFYGVDDEYGDILVQSNYSEKKFLIYPHTKNMSATYKRIESYDENAQRKVQENEYVSYYIDRKGKRCSLPFVYESEIDDNEKYIQTVINSSGNNVQVLVDKNHKWISHLFDSIQPLGNEYIGYRKKDNSIHKLDAHGTEIASITHKEYKSRILDLHKQPQETTNSQTTKTETTQERI